MNKTDFIAALVLGTALLLAPVAHASVAINDRAPEAAPSEQEKPAKPKKQKNSDEESPAKEVTEDPCAGNKKYEVTADGTKVVRDACLEMFQ
jgi:hypothetical protein